MFIVINTANDMVSTFNISTTKLFEFNGKLTFFQHIITEGDKNISITYNSINRAREVVDDIIASSEKGRKIYYLPSE